MVLIFALALTLAEGPAPATPSVPPPVVATPRPVTVVDMLKSPATRVRSGGKRFAGLLTEGARRSRTFADLVSRVQDTNVIVYVEASWDLPPDMAGRILLQGVAGGQRYLRIQVRATLQGDPAIAVIAHELRHALEVAEDPAVLDDRGLVALYQRIGHVSAGTRGYDTEAARDVGRIVRDELIG
jgi:hypothetical protein